MLIKKDKVMAKPKKSTSVKKPSVKVSDLTPEKDAKGGAIRSSKITLK
jgi:hypothetical protein